GFPASHSSFCSLDLDNWAKSALMQSGFGAVCWAQGEGIHSCFRYHSLLVMAFAVPSVEGAWSVDHDHWASVAKDFSVFCVNEVLRLGGFFP
ncbi:hypothetical protein Ancab_016822, partial [Ancistrocladus abbreviatus]